MALIFSRLSIASFSRLHVPASKKILAVASSMTSSPQSNWRHKSSKPEDLQAIYAQEVNPVDTHFLTETFVKKKDKKTQIKLSLWDQIQTYKVGMYQEKTFLIDPKVSAMITDAIEKHSERGLDTKFIDADAGLCLVTKEVMQRDLFPSSKSHFVFEKDPLLNVLNRRAIDNYLTKECKVCSVSLAQSVINWYASSLDKEASVYTEMSVFPPSDWYSPHPNYTLFGTVTHGLVKYLTAQCLYRNDVKYGEFKLGRPEFFLVISGRTWLLLSKSMSSTKLQRTVMFQLLFDYECVAELPRKGFLPWKNTSTKIKSARSQEYSALDGTFFLIKLRPKKDLGLPEGVPTHYFDFFVQALCQNAGNRRLIPVIESWIPGGGLDFVRKGYSVYTLAKEIPLTEIVPLFHLLVKQKNFSNGNNNFVVQAESYFQSSHHQTKESALYYDNLKRDLKITKEGSGASGRRQKPTNIFGA